MAEADVGIVISVAAMPEASCHLCIVLTGF